MSFFFSSRSFVCLQRYRHNVRLCPGFVDARGNWKGCVLSKKPGGVHELGCSAGPTGTNKPHGAPTRWTTPIG